MVRLNKKNAANAFKTNLSAKHNIVFPTQEESHQVYA